MQSRRLARETGMLIQRYQCKTQKLWEIVYPRLHCTVLYNKTKMMNIVGYWNSKQRVGKLIKVLPFFARKGVQKKKS